ncbi:hypothetical protein [Lysobacter arvi]|uniref:Transmembrane protein n=1 Tax=Lysobacter arvi TaxID=3038776 RepID=A0ABU1CB37_9GAMM|nr:hypothetical protein [Lysobacter arvi]MDR0182381.1 hypothetical protein [Lysobacter arvi]
MHPAWKVAALLALAAFAIGSLVAGASYLGVPLRGGLPLGNALAASGLCAIAACGATIAHRGPVRCVAVVALVAALAWLPVSIAMAGNLALVFSGARGDAWIAWSAGVALLSFASLALAALQRVVRAVRSRATPAPFAER